MARGKGRLSDLSKPVAAAVEPFGMSETDGCKPFRGLALDLAGIDSESTGMLMVRSSFDLRAPSDDSA